MRWKAPIVSCQEKNNDNDQVSGRMHAQVNLAYYGHRMLIILRRLPLHKLVGTLRLSCPDVTLQLLPLLYAFSLLSSR
jgi:hypothetical protein